jgi:hypothetical protein
MRGPNRPVALVVIAALLAVGAVADRSGRPRTGPPVALDTASESEPESALSSTWYCAAGTAGGDAQADGTVVIVNAAASERSGTFTVFPLEGDHVAVPIKLAPRSRVDLRYAAVVTSPWAAGLVEVDGGGVVAEQVVSGPAGRDVTPCARDSADAWYFASGSTNRDATMQLAFFNPFPDEAIVDMRFATDDGTRVPSDFQGLVVPPRRIIVRDIGEHVSRRDQIATTVSVRSGRVVAARIQRFAGSGRGGLGLTIGLPAAAPIWHFPDGYIAAGITERFEIYNPSSREAVVELRVDQDGEPIEPFELTIPAQQRLTFLANDQDRIPKGVPHASTVRSLNGVPVVAEISFDSVEPAPRRGYSSSPGATRAAERWLLADGSSTESTDEWIVLQNVGTAAATVSLFAVAQGQRVPIDGLQKLDLAAGSRRSIRVSDHLRRPDLSVLVESTRAIVAGRTLYSVGRPGLSSTIGVILR